MFTQKRTANDLHKPEMTYERSNQGFTMMEVMIVVAILAVMAALIFVNIVPFMRSLYQKEMDETAREIYIAAQNHLSIADSMGFLKGKSDGTPAGDDIYYFVVEQGGEAQETGSNNDPNGVDESGSLLSQMLPFGSIDDTVRLGGSYVISYNKKTSRVVEVFYRNPSGRYDNGHSFNIDDPEGTYASLKDYRGAENKSTRLDGYGDDKVIIGWYGGDGNGLAAKKLTAPKVKVENGDRLIVKAWWEQNSVDAGFTTGLKVGIIITGKTSGKHTPLLEMSSTTVGGLVYEGCLDDIASSYSESKGVLEKNNGHFAERFAEWGLIPGEDVTISTFAYYDAQKNAVYEVAKGPTVTTNSLFRSIGYEIDADGEQTEVREARISHIRHLENLSKDISGYDLSKLDEAEAARLSGESDDEDQGQSGSMTTASELANAESQANGVSQGQEPGLGGQSASTGFAPTHARQIKDMDFTDFMDTILDGGGETDGKVKIHAYDRTIGDSDDDTFMPVSTDYALDYNGGNHKISNVAVKTAGDAGLFSELPEESSLENMKLMSFDIESTGDNGNAGALAGALKGVTVKGVLVFNEPYSGTNANRQGFGPNFGGDTTDEKLEISGKGNVGGLVGSAENCTIEKSAASVYVKSSDANAGGLIGEAKSVTTVTGCYAGGHTADGAYNMETDSGAGRVNVIAATNAGGLIGSSAAEIKASYATNSVSGATAGGLVGSVVSGGNVSYSYAAGKVAGTTAGAFVGSNGGALGAGNKYAATINGPMNTIGSGTSVTVADMFPTLASYQEFAKANDPREAKPYDSALVAAYTIGGKCLYPMPTITDLLKQAGSESVLEDSDLDLVKTHYGDWPKLETEVVNQ